MGCQKGKSKDVPDARFVCKKCGAVAKSKKNICKPKKIDSTPKP